MLALKSVAQGCLPKGFRLHKFSGSQSCHRSKGQRHTPPAEAGHAVRAALAHRSLPGQRPCSAARKAAAHLPSLQQRCQLVPRLHAILIAFLQCSNKSQMEGCNGQDQIIHKPVNGKSANLLSLAIVDRCRPQHATTPAPSSSLQRLMPSNTFKDQSGRCIEWGSHPEENC